MSTKKLLLIAATLLATSAQAQNYAGKIIFSLPGAGTVASDSIFAMNPDGSNMTFITNGARPRLSPLGTYLGFIYGTNADRRLNHIYFKNTTGSPYNYFDNSSEFNLFNFDFSPTEDRVIYDWQGGFYNQLANDPNGQSINNASGAGDNYDEYPRICKTDSAVVSHNINYGLYTMPYPGPSNGLIPNTQPGDLSPYWSPDGQWIYFAKQYSGTDFKLHNIYRIHRDGSNLQQITNLPNTDTLGMSLVVTANGKWVVAPARIHGVTGLYRFKANPIGFDTSGQLIRAFNHLSSPTNNFWLGNVDSVADHTVGIATTTKPATAIYPNPVEDRTLNIILVSAAEQVQLYDALGRYIANFGKLHEGHNAVQLPVLTPGTYYLTGKSDAGAFNEKIEVGNK